MPGTWCFMITRTRTGALAGLSATLLVAGCAGSPSSQIRTAEELEEMLLTAEDMEAAIPLTELGGSWELQDPRQDPDLLPEDVPTYGPADWDVCTDAPTGAAEQLANIPPFTAIMRITWLPPNDDSRIHSVLGGENLLSADPDALSTAIAVWEACPPGPGDTDETPRRLPLDVGDEALAWTFSGQIGSSTWQDWGAVVRHGAVLMEIGAAEYPRDAGTVLVLSDDAFLHLVTTAAEKLD